MRPRGARTRVRVLGVYHFSPLCNLTRVFFDSRSRRAYTRNEGLDPTVSAFLPRRAPATADRRPPGNNHSRERQGVALLSLPYTTPTTTTFERRLVNQDVHSERALHTETVGCKLPLGWRSRSTIGPSRVPAVRN